MCNGQPQPSVAGTLLFPVQTFGTAYRPTCVFRHCRRHILMSLYLESGEWSVSLVNFVICSSPPWPSFVEICPSDTFPYFRRSFASNPDKSNVPDEWKHFVKCYDIQKRGWLKSEYMNTSWKRMNATESRVTQREEDCGCRYGSVWKKSSLRPTEISKL